VVAGVPKAARVTVVETPLHPVIPAPTPLLVLAIPAPMTAVVPKVARITALERRDALFLESLATVVDVHLLDPPAILAPTPLPPAILAPTPLPQAIQAPTPLLVLAIPAPMTAVVPKTARGIAF